MRFHVVSLVLLFLFVGFSTSEAKTTASIGSDSRVCFRSAPFKDQVLTQLKAGKNPFQDSTIQSEVVSVQSYDVYRFQLPQGLPARSRPVYSSSLALGQQVEFFLKRLTHHTSFGEDLSLVFHKELNLSRWTPGAHVPRTPEETVFHATDPHCLRLEIAIQEKGRVFYDAFLFSKLDTLSQAAIVLHELIQFKALAPSLETTRRIWELVGVLVSRDEISQIRSVELDSRFRLVMGGRTGNQAHFIHQSVNGNDVWLYTQPRKITFYPNGNLKSGTLAKDLDIDWNGLTLGFPQESFIEFFQNGGVSRGFLGRPVEVTARGRSSFFISGGVEFFPGGALKEVTLDSPYQALIGTHRIDLETRNDAYFRNRIQFFESGAMKKVTSFRPLRLMIHGHAFFFGRTGKYQEGTRELSFYENGVLQSGYLGRESLLAIGKAEIRIAGRREVFFHSNGVFQKGWVISPFIYPIAGKTVSFGRARGWSEVTFHPNQGLYCAALTSRNGVFLKIRGEQRRVGGKICLHPNGQLKEVNFLDRTQLGGRSYLGTVRLSPMGEILP